MRRIIQSVFIVALLSLSATTVWANPYDYTKEDLNGYNMQPSFKTDDESDFSRSGNAVYAYGGFLYNHLFLTSNLRTLNNAATTVNYNPDAILPSGFMGLGLGLGKQMSHHVDMQLEYQQFFSEDKTATTGGSTYKTLTKITGFLADAGYVFNPDDQFQVMAKFGAEIAEYNSSFTVNNAEYYPTGDNTQINPAAGADLLIQFTRHIGMRVSALYTMDVQNVNSHGNVSALAGFNYTF